VSQLEPLAEIAVEELFIEGNEICKSASYMSDLKKLVPSLQGVDLIDPTDSLLVAASRRPSTPRINYPSANEMKEAIPLIRPSTAKDGPKKVNLC
jgi:hypothetical protein